MNILSTLWGPVGSRRDETRQLGEGRNWAPSAFRSLWMAGAIQSALQPYWKNYILKLNLAVFFPIFNRPREREYISFFVQRVLNLLESSLLWLYLPTTENLLCSSPRLSGDPTGCADPPLQNHTRRRSRSTPHLPGPGQLLSSRTPTLEGWFWLPTKHQLNQFCLWGVCGVVICR